MEEKLPFVVKRFGPRGPDSLRHTFCVVATANGECVRKGWSESNAAINGAFSNDALKCRAAVQRLCDGLNEQWRRYLRGEFHS